MGAVAEVVAAGATDVFGKRQRTSDRSHPLTVGGLPQEQALQGGETGRGRNPAIRVCLGRGFLERMLLFHSPIRAQVTVGTERRPG